MERYKNSVAPTEYFCDFVGKRLKASISAAVKSRAYLLISEKFLIRHRAGNHPQADRPQADLRRHHRRHRRRDRRWAPRICEES